MLVALVNYKIGQPQKVQIKRRTRRPVVSWCIIHLVSREIRIQKRTTMLYIVMRCWRKEKGLTAESYMGIILYFCPKWLYMYGVMHEWWWKTQHKVQLSEPWLVSFHSFTAYGYHLKGEKDRERSSKYNCMFGDDSDDNTYKWCVKNYP